MTCDKLYKAVVFSRSAANSNILCWISAFIFASSLALSFCNILSCILNCLSDLSDTPKPATPAGSCNVLLRRLISLAPSALLTSKLLAILADIFFMLSIRMKFALSTLALSIDKVFVASNWVFSRIWFTWNNFSALIILWLNWSPSNLANSIAASYSCFLALFVKNSWVL